MFKKDFFNKKISAVPFDVIKELHKKNSAILVKQATITKQNRNHLK